MKGCVTKYPSAEQGGKMQLHCMSNRRVGAEGFASIEVIQIVTSHAEWEFLHVSFAQTLCESHSCVGFKIAIMTLQ